jgi:predicted nucleic acid-binding protein
MIYFDTAYVVKCFLPEKGFEQVRELLHQNRTAVSSAIGRVEFMTAIRRAVREARLPAAAIDTVLALLAADELGGLVSWIPATPNLLELTANAVRLAPLDTAIRGADALHIVSARENGFRRIYTNDRQMLAAAKHFGIEAVDVIKH